MKKLLDQQKFSMTQKCNTRFLSTLSPSGRNINSSQDRNKTKRGTFERRIWDLYHNSLAFDSKSLLNNNQVLESARRKSSKKSRRIPLTPITNNNDAAHQQKSNIDRNLDKLKHLKNHALLNGGGNISNLGKVNAAALAIGKSTFENESTSKYI
jgi:hypothetical protein